ncbi:MAG: TIGR04283 family arsenosugar biosynthesis glycosyltransferase [Acidocella sp.]|nr:TIGR04283 family arsenosugar biosynthesis glycosyltransferase [Acidocella sp.]
MSRTKSEHFGNFSLSVVIPTLNASKTLPGCLASLRPGAHLIREIIIVDGGSADDTLQLTEAAIVVNAPAGRGGQLRAGIAVASGDFLLLLHADTRLGANWPEAVAAANPDMAGYFRLRLNSPRRLARMIERVVALRCWILTLPYGDQGLLISQALLTQIGGMPDLPLMEDVALVRRLKGRLRPLPADATTSAEKYERDGWLRRPLRNLLCLALYFAGFPPEKIGKIYG